MPDIAATLEALRLLCGAWHGTGRASFPTIGEHEYRERLRVASDPMRPLLFYEQAAEHRPAGTADPRGFHWEAGFFRVVGPGQVQLSNAQNNGRLEVLDLVMAPYEGGFRLEGAASGQFSDPRMKAAFRRYELHGDTLTYVVEMATDRVAARTQHLAAELQRGES